jgi:predicted dehydrogenase
MRIAFLGTHHPHVFQRVALLKQRDDVEIVGYWEQDEVIPLKLQERLAIPRFQRAASLLAQPFDIAFVHSLDEDVPRLALMAADAGAKGILLEKPGAAQPEQIFRLAEQLAGSNVVVEFGWRCTMLK